MTDDALSAARRAAAGLDSAAAADRVGAEWDASRQQFTLPFCGAVAAVTWPGFEVTVDGGPVRPHIAALLVYHLAQSDGSRPTGAWTAFADLPSASFYATAFRGYTGAAIARHFGTRAAALGGSAERVGGEVIPGLADSAWRIPALPRVPIALLWWDADDEFEARAELLFDSTAAHHLTTDGCAVLGSWLTSLLVSNA